MIVSKSRKSLIKFGEKMGFLKVLLILYSFLQSVCFFSVATHSSEFQYVFGLSLINPMSEQLSAAELRFQRNFIDMIVGFATIG